MTKKSPNLLVVDLETSGSNPAIHSPLAVALVPLSNDVEPGVFYVRPTAVIWNDVGKKNFRKYESVWTEFAVSPLDAYNAIERYLRSNWGETEVFLVGHNVGFDRSFLSVLAHQAGHNQLPLISHRSIDTHTLLFLLHLQGKLPASALSSDGAFEYFSIAVPAAVRHTALGDALGTKKLFTKLLSNFGAGDVVDMTKP